VTAESANEASANEARLIATIERLCIATEQHEHEAVFTVEASAELHARIPGAHTKNLFLKDAAGRFWLVSAPHDARVDLKALPGVIGSKKLSFGKAEDMVRLLGVTPGSVTPLAAMNDADGRVSVVIDSRLASAARVNIHPLRNTATLGVAGADLLVFLAQVDHPPLVALLPGSNPV
jgi:Ala-tRNA(Pro) deacylase